VRWPNVRWEDVIRKVGLQEEIYEPAEWIYMARDGCRWLAVVLALLNLSEQWHLRSVRTPRGGVTLGCCCIQHFPFQSSLYRVISCYSWGHYQSAVSPRHDTYFCGIWSHEMNVTSLHFVAYAWTWNLNYNLLLVWMLQDDVSLPSFCCTVNAYLRHLAGGSVVVVNIIGHSDHRTLAAFVFIC